MDSGKGTTGNSLQDALESLRAHLSAPKNWDIVPKLGVVMLSPSAEAGKLLITKVSDS